MGGKSAATLGRQAGVVAAGLALGVGGFAYVLVKARGAIERRLDKPGAGSGRLGSLAARLPVLTASCIVVGGLLLAVRGAGQL